MSDPFNTESDAWVKMDDLIGRTLLVLPKEVGERLSNIRGQENKSYEYVVCDVAVLDGDETELIEDVPGTLDDFQFAGGVIETLKRKIGKTNSDGTPKMSLGVLVQKPSQYKTNRWAWEEPTEQGIKAARAFLKAYPEFAPPADPFSN